MSNLVLLSGKEPLTSTQMAIALRVASQKMEISDVVQFNPDAITAAIVECAKNYCGFVKQNDSVFLECFKFLQAHFPKLDYREISVAFSMGAANIFECDLSAYNGVFTVNILGKVMSGYNAHMQKVTKDWKEKNPAPEIERNKSEVEMLIEKSLQAEKQRFYEVCEIVKQGKEFTDAHELAMKYQASFLSENGFFEQFGLNRKELAREAFETTKKYYEVQAISTNKEVRYKARVILKDIMDCSMPKEDSEFWRENRANYSRILYLKAVQQFNNQTT